MLRRSHNGTVSSMKLFDMARLTALSLLVGACVGATTTTNVYYDKIGVPSIFRYAALERDFLTEIHGNPSTASKAAFDARVIAATHGNARGLPTNFTTTPSANARDGYRMVMVFSGDRYMGGKAVCGGLDSTTLKPISGRVEIQAAFCYNDDVLSQVHVAYPQGESALEDAVTQVVLALFPLYDPTIDPGNDNNPLLN